MDAADYLARRAQRTQVAAGTSSYTSNPETHLDPALFDATERLLPGPRRWLLDTLYGFLRGRGLVDAPAWAVPWIAGSGASYQWAAARSPGDLDMLIGVDYPAFRQANERYANLSDKQISAELNDQMREGLWPATAQANVGGSTYEVTWYVNPGATDIRVINPYAGYNVMHTEWTVRPIELPAEGGSWIPKQFHEGAANDLAAAQRITGQYNAALEAHNSAPNEAARRNALVGLRAATTEGSALFDEIHLGRKQAFSTAGEGYRDWHSARWQLGKLHGTVQALHSIKDAQSEAQQDVETALFGKPLMDSSHELRAALKR